MWTVTLSPTLAAIVGPGFVSAPEVKDQPPGAVPYRLIATAAPLTCGDDRVRPPSPPKKVVTVRRAIAR